MNNELIHKVCESYRSLANIEEITDFKYKRFLHEMLESYKDLVKR